MEQLGQYAHKVGNYLTHLYSEPSYKWDTLEWFLICVAVFIPLAFLFPNVRKQPYVRKDMLSDGIYWFAGPTVYGPVLMKFMGIFFSLDVIHFIQTHGHLADMPLLLQAVVILLITDFLQYWAHRGFHRSASLWKFHAIHHSTKHVDWMSTARFHPVNIILYSTLINALVITLGFDYRALYLLAPFNAMYSPLVHANLNWTYGPFKYVLASPVFHRWHHTYPEEGGNKNFAPTFPFLDLMFGTFYMPEGKRPEVFGTPNDHITGNFFNQLIYPFKGNSAYSAQNTNSPAAEIHQTY